MLPNTSTRVVSNTPNDVNRIIRRRTEEKIAASAAGGRVAITRRLNEIEHEWDIERTLQANAATVSLVGLTLGATLNRRWFLLPGIVAGFLLQHSLQGWCPPLSFFRRLGFRTMREIDEERYALKALRGDFTGVDLVSEPILGKVGDALQAASG